MVWLLTFRDKAWMRAVWLLVCIHTAFALVLPRSYFLTTFGDLTQCALLLSILLSFIGNTTVGDRRFRMFWLLLALGGGLWLSAQVLWTCGPQKPRAVGKMHGVRCKWRGLS